MTSLEKFYFSAILLAALAMPCSVKANGSNTSANLTWRQVYSQAQEKLDQQKFSEAEKLLRQALDTMPNDNAHEEYRSQLYLKLANTLTLSDQTNEAQNYYRKLLDLETRHHGSDSVHIVPALLALGSIQEAEGNHTLAMQYYRRALQINERNYGPYSPAVADNLHRIGRAGWRNGDRMQSSADYKQSLNILLQQPTLTASDQLLRVMNDYSDKLKGNDNSSRDLLLDFKKEIQGKSTPLTSIPVTSITVTSIPVSSTPAPISAPVIPTQATIPTPSNGASQSASSLGNAQPSFTEQDRLRLNAVKEQQTETDPGVTLRGIAAPYSNQTLDPAYKVVNSSLSNQVRYGQSADNLERSIAADVDALGPNHPTVANDLTSLAQIRIAEGKYSEARNLLNKALPIYEKVYGVNNNLTISALASLAFVEGQTGNVETAIGMYKRALAAGQSVLGPNSLETARILNEMAHLYYAQGKLNEARTYYEWAVASTEAAVGEHDSLLAACLRDYAQVLRTMGKDDEASSAELKASRIVASAQ